MRNKAFFILFVSLFLLLFSGCGPGQLFGPTYTPTSTFTNTNTPTPTDTPTPTFTSTLTPTPTLDVMSLNGFWEGANSEGNAVNVEINDQTIISFTTEITLSYGSLHCGYNLILHEPIKIQNNSVLLRLREESTSENPDLYPLKLTFTSSNRAEGTLQAISGYGVACQIGNELRFEFSTKESILGGPWSLEIKKK